MMIYATVVTAHNHLRLFELLPAVLAAICTPVPGFYVSSSAPTSSLALRVARINKIHSTSQHEAQWIKKIQRSAIVKLSTLL